MQSTAWYFHTSIPRSYNNETTIMASFPDKEFNFSQTTESELEFTITFDIYQDILFILIQVSQKPCANVTNKC